MGVAGLWDILKPAAKVRSLSELAITEGFVKNPDGVRGFRVGIDASIWFFHAEYGKEGENPVLRTLFFRCATLMHAPFLPVFVFDGPRRPEVKRGKRINRQPSKLVPGMKSIVEAFGFEWKTAPAEAEAELAYLNRIGAIDGILTDDVDTFLFGATTIIRNPSNNLSGNKTNPALNSDGRDDKNHTWVFKLEDITKHKDIGLTRGGLILIGLLSGGDYEQGGVGGCGPKIAHGLARCGFGDSLLQATVEMSREELKGFLAAWREDLCHELRTNSRGHIGRKCVSVAGKIPPNFPDIDVLLSYTNPITSETEGRPVKKSDLTWSKEPNIGEIAARCELYFEWGYKEAIIKRFRTIVWPGAVLRILRRGVLDLDQKAKAIGGIPSTPRKNGKNGPRPVGTPSKLITKHFSSMPSSNADSDDEDGGNRLIVKIHSERKHAYTDGTLEYRLEVAPAQLVRIAESGLMGLRQPIGPDEWDEEEPDEEGGKKGKKAPPEPSSHIRVWMPACMVHIAEPHIVEDYEDVQRKKAEKKANKGKGRGKGKKAAPVAEEEEAGPSSAETTPVKKAPRAAAASRKQTARAPSPTPLSLHSSDDEGSRASVPPVRDLIKKKPAAAHPGPGIKTFFKAQKPTSNAGKKPSKEPTPSLKASSVIDIPDSPLAADYPAFLAGPISRDKPVTGGSNAPKQLFKDLTKKKTSRSSSTTTTSYSSSKPLETWSTQGSTSTSKKSTLQSIEKELSFFSSSSTSVASSQSQSGSSRATLATMHETDSFLYDSDEPGQETPSAVTISREPSGSRKHTRNPTVTPSTSQESLQAHISKSPKKSPQHTSPRRVPLGSALNNIGKVSRVRSFSPTLALKPAKANTVIEISDSDSEEDLPPPKVAFAPLLAARARKQPSISQASEKPKKQSQLSRPQPVKKPSTATVIDIIDLT